MAAIKTTIRITATDTTYNIDGEWTAAQVKSMYASQIPGLASMNATESRSTSPEGEVLTLTFQTVSGTKG